MKILACLALAALIAPIASAQQTLQPPPIKMGLWKTTTVATMAGLQLPPEVEARMKAMGRSLTQPQTTTMLVCITPEKWRQAFSRSKDQSCQFANQQQSSTGMSADINCTSGSGRTTTGHMQMTFDSDTRMHGNFHMNVASEQQPQPMTVDTTYQGDYQGSDCQGISPDSPKVVR